MGFFEKLIIRRCPICGNKLSKSVGKPFMKRTLTLKGFKDVAYVSYVYRCVSEHCSYFLEEHERA